MDWREGEREPRGIAALQAHSNGVKVNLSLCGQIEVTENDAKTVVHQTKRAVLERIMEEGLKPGGDRSTRQCTFLAFDGPQIPEAAK